jgi:branched-chain amino acid transport system ATP-binding protein
MTTSTHSPVIEVTNLAVNYGQVPALNDVSITVNQGEFVVLLGPNGAGKTTTLRAISGLAKVRNGSIRFNGAALPRSAAAVTRAGVGHVPEGRKIFPEHTVLENMQLGAYKLRRSKAKRDEAIDSMFDLFPRLKERRDQGAGTLSGGEAQMLACARALVSQPSVLMLDEPSLGIAPKLVAELFGYIRRLHREEGLTVLLVDQSARLALALADRGYVMGEGRVQVAGTAAELSNNPEVKRVFLGA